MTNRFERVFRVLVCVLSLAALAHAQPDPDEAESLDDPKTEAAAFEIAQRTMSPFCPGRTLADCPSDSAAAWRQDIRRMLKEGKSGAEIRRVLNERSGLNLTGTPESSIGWMLPVGLLVGAVGLLALVVVRFRKGADEGSQGASTDAAHDEDDDDDDDDDDELEGADDEADPGDTDDDEASDDDELEARLRRELEDDDDANV